METGACNGETGGVMETGACNGEMVVRWRRARVTGRWAVRWRQARAAGRWAVRWRGSCAAEMGGTKQPSVVGRASEMGGATDGAMETGACGWEKGP
jgi:hypothetical protein